MWCLQHVMRNVWVKAQFKLIMKCLTLRADFRAHFDNFTIWICFILYILFDIYIHVMVKLNFQQSLHQFSVSHDPSEITLICWFAAQELFLQLLSVLKTVVLLNIFRGNHFCRIIRWVDSKDQHLFVIYKWLYCHLINLMHPLLNKSINFFKNLLTLNFRMV